MLQFAQPVSRIDVHHNRAGFRDTVLRNQPFRTIRTPYADAIAFLNADRNQASGQPFHFALQFAIRVTKALMNRDERKVVSIVQGNPIETCADRFTEKRRAGRTMNVRGNHNTQII